MVVFVRLCLWEMNKPGPHSLNTGIFSCMQYSIGMVYL